MPWGKSAVEASLLLPHWPLLAEQSPSDRRREAPKHSVAAGDVLSRCLKDV